MKDMHIIFLQILASTLFCLLPPLAVADSGSTVKIIADSIEQEQAGAYLRATGDVSILWQNYKLFADKVEYEDEGRSAIASGNVKLLKDDDLLIADTLVMELDSKLGVATNGTLSKGRTARQGRGSKNAPGATSDYLRVKGSVIEKVGDGRYRLEKGSFTACEADPPSWSFSASDLDVTVDDYAEGRNVVFSVGVVPVFYTPYILFPVARERKSGFLLPRMGNSDTKGFFTEIPFYWVISPSAEATFDLDIQSKKGVGLGIDTAWLRSGGSHGKMYVYTIYDSEMGRERAEVSLQSKEVISPVTEFNTDLHFASDRSFYRNFSQSSGDYNRQALDTSVSLTRRWNAWYLAGETRILNNLDSTENEKTLQRLPEVTLSGTGERIGTVPLYAGFGGRITNFYRRDDVTGQRLMIQPTLTYYAPLPEGYSLSGWGGVQQRLYHAANGEGEGDKGTVLAVAGAHASARFTRLFDADAGDLTRIKHTLTPAVDYSFIEEKNQNDLPFFDYDDRVIGQNFISWSLVNSFTGRFDKAAGPEYRELLNLRLSQGYQLSGGRRDLLNPADELHPSTDIRFEATANPLSNVAVVTDNRFSPYSKAVTTSSIGAHVNDKAGNAAGMSYRRVYEKLDYLEGNLSLSILKPIILQYSGRYSFDGEKFLENYYVVEYRHQCWSISFSYRERPDNKESLVNFTLAGIGGLGKVKGF